MARKKVPAKKSVAKKSKARPVSKAPAKSRPSPKQKGRAKGKVVVKPASKAQPVLRVVKNAPVKTSAVSGTVSKSVKTAEVVRLPQRELESVNPPGPARAPVRRIMRDDRSIVVVADKVEPSQVVSVSMVIKPEVEPEPVAAPVERADVVLPKQPRVAWGALSREIPVQQRFYLSMAEKECRAASSWPFPFARFVSALPDEICGRAMVLMLMALEHPVGYLAETFNESEAIIEARLMRDRGELLERCSNHCPEMYRKMKTQLGGVGVSIEMLIEKYLVSRVDRNFQLTVGAVVLQALSA